MSSTNLSQLFTMRRLASVGALALALGGCGAALTQREACYAGASAWAAQEAMAQCPGTFAQCPDRDAILLELQRNAATCAAMPDSRP